MQSTLIPHDLILQHFIGLPSSPYFPFKSLFFPLNTCKFSANLHFPYLIPTLHSARNIVNFNQKISKHGYYCKVQWDSGSTYVSNTLLIFFIEKLVCWNMRKQNKYSPNKLAVYTPTTKSLTAVTGAAQNPAEWVRLGRVRAAEVQSPLFI